MSRNSTSRPIVHVVGVLVAFLTITIFPANVGAEQPNTVFLMVELNEKNDDLDSRDFRRALREVRKISDRAPRTYDAKGQRVSARDLRRWRVVEVAANEAEQTIAELAGNPAVASVRREYLYTTTATPNDPLFASQYALHGSASVQATGAWDVSTGSSNTLIAIIDGGVDATHEELRDKMWRGPNGEAGWDFVENRPAYFGHQHATHVAGIAAASSNNGKGMAGANWGARIMSVRVLNAYGIGREENIIHGIEYAVAQGADIINLSLAGSASSAMLDAVENAYASDVLVVAAAGNSGRSTDTRRVFPVCAERNGVNMVLGVGATDADGEPKSFSNYGACVDVSAPGDDIVSSVPGNRYREMSGTSMSSPLVAGVAGLYLAKHPSANPSTVIAALVDSMDPFTGKKATEWNTRYKGRINAARALGVSVAPPAGGGEGSGNPAPTPTPAVTTGPASLKISLNAPSEAPRGGTVTYQATIKNTGGSGAEQTTIELDVDRDIIFAGADGCTVDRNDILCSAGSLGAGQTKIWNLTFALPEEELRCGDRLRARAEALMIDNRGRLRKQARSDRLTTNAICS